MKSVKQISRFLILIQLVGFTVAAHANIPGYGLNRLFMVSEWNQLCKELGSGKKIAYCKEGIHRAVAYGRSLGPFELISPADQSQLQSRSGVLFRNNLNEKIVSVSEDSGMRTTVKLQSDVQCQAYSAAPDLIGLPSVGRDYRHVIKSWLNVYTDAISQIQGIHIVAQGGKRILKFDAVTDGKRVIRGAYIVDAQANASIFSTCDHPPDSVEAARNADLFFNSIMGSARKFI